MLLFLVGKSKTVVNTEMAIVFSYLEHTCFRIGGVHCLCICNIICCMSQNCKRKNTEWLRTSGIESLDFPHYYASYLFFN